jgi:c(7)-type cytochrome triheme protein
MKNGRLTLCVLVILIAVAGGGWAGEAAPRDYGKVIMNNFSQKEGLAAVEFDHWLHRANYTCRLCHSDIGFALKAGATEVKAADNMKGLYCGVCHNGKMQHGGKAVFPACGTDKADARCQRCHSQGKNVKRENDFAAFAAKMPKERFGNGINWDKASSEGAIKPGDYLEGLSIKKPAQPIQQDFTIHPKAGAKNDILFSHKKHVAWNGCEVCHPEIFKGGKRGTTTYSMNEINQGKFCGVCHSTVSFPLTDCDRCHSKPVK